MSFTRVVAITGCDSGLGWAMAARAAREGMVTVAGMYQGTETKAAGALRRLNAHPCQLDVTDPHSISGFKEYVLTLLKNNPNYTLHAVVNNAAVMTVGDYEWQTESAIANTFNTNLMGTLRVTSAFLPDLRRAALKGLTKPRLINVGSHCGMYHLPSFSAYSASKAGVIALSRALRLEVKPHGMASITFIPGGFVGSSHILSKQASNGEAMLENLDEEQKAYYEKRIMALNRYLGAVPKADFDALHDQNILGAFMKALTDKEPKTMYKVEPWRYVFYYNLFGLPLPEFLYSWLVKKFLDFPEA